MATRKSFADFPETIFCSIIEYLNWHDVGRFDNALLDINARNTYLDALTLRQVKVERNEFWNNALDNRILNWMIIRNIWVTSWENNSVDDERLMAIATGLPQLLTLNISRCADITDAGLMAIANGLPQLQSLNISGCDSITAAGREIAQTINRL